MDSLYDRILLQVGNDGTYQKKFDFVYNILFASLWSMAYFNILLALTVTPHTCKLPERPENISENAWKTIHIPRVKNVDGSDGYSDCLIYKSLGNNETTECDLFDYENTWYETTVPSDNNWVCKNDLISTNILVYSRISELIGSVFFGWFGDVFGRKLTFFISVAMLVIGRFISILWSSSFLIFTAGCIIASFPSWTATQCASVISVEISSPKRRATVAKFRLVSISAGMCLTPFYFWWLRNWKSYLIVTTGFQIPFLIFYWKLIESPQWLWINGKSKATLQTLKRIAQANKRTLSPDSESEILTTRPIKSTEVLGLLALFSHWRIAVNTILQLSVWFSVSLNYNYVVMSTSEESDGNPFLNFAWQALAEIPGYFIAAWLADRMGRRFTGIISFLSTTLIWIIYGYREVCDFNWIKNEWLSTALVVINKCLMTISYYIIDLLNMELYPTCLRQSGMSLGNVVSNGAAAIVPYILHLRRRVDVRYPSILLTISTIFFGVLATIFLPETLNVKLPETLEDAKIFGGRHSRRESENIEVEEM